MAKIEALQDVTVVAESAPTINANYDKIVTAFDNTLSRDGSAPNTMSADIDMNNNDILNVGSLDVDTLTVQGIAISDLLDAASDAQDDAAAAQVAATQAAASAVSAAASAAQADSVANQLPVWQGAWVTATAYAVGDEVQESGNLYICEIAHTSGTFATDLAALKWALRVSKGDAGAGTGDMLKTENLSGLSNYSTARSNLGVPGLSAAADINAHWEIQDNSTASLRFGADGDVKMSYDNANALMLIEPLNTPTAKMKMRFPEIELMNMGGTETFAKFIENAAVELFFDNSKKFETLTGGAKVTGDLSGDSISGNWVASTGESTTGTDNTQIMTPLRVAEAINNRFTVSYSSDGGYISFKPTAASANRMYFQWKRYSLASPASSNQLITWAVAFPTATLVTWVGVDGASSQMIGCSSHTNSTVVVQKGNGDVGARTGWVFGVGY